MPERLEITDGTTTIRLIQQDNNAEYLNDWQPAIAQPKGGGVYQQSALSDGRRLVDRRFDNVTELFNLKISGLDQDDAARELQRLRSLLEKAVAYWTTDWQSEPVYFIVQASCETNERYGLIINWQTPNDENPFAQPWLQGTSRAVLDDWNLSVERDHWTENAPGTGTATAASAVEAYNGRNFGNIDSAGTRDPVTTSDVYVANKRSEANLTHVFEEDGGVFSANLLDAALPHRLWPAVPTGADELYFGIDTTVSDSGPFNNLVFDVGTAQTGVTSSPWQYWNGASWTTFPTVRDWTASTGGTGVAFTRTGVNSVHWEIPSDWATRAINGVTGYWARSAVATVGGGPTGATQQNRRIYSVTWPYIEVQSTEITGTIPSLLRILTDEEDTEGAPVKGVVIGLRSVSRGASFTAVLNASDEQNPSGVTVSAGTNTSFIDLVASPTGRVMEYNPAGADAIARRALWALDDTIMPNYSGVFHVFCRYITTGATTSYTGYLAVRTFGTTNPAFTSSTVAIAAGATTNFGVMDLGRVELPPFIEHADSDESGQVNLELWIGSSDGTDNLRIVDLWLIPVDEWAMDAWQDNATIGNLNARFDSLQYPRKVLRAGIFNSSYTTINQVFKVIKNGPVILQTNSRQRLWLLWFREDVSGREESYQYLATRMQLQTNQRYFSYRGDQ